MTAYRQEALACAAAMSKRPRHPRDLRQEMPNGPKILRRIMAGPYALATAS